MLLSFKLQLYQEVFGVSFFGKIEPTPENLFPMRSDITIKKDMSFVYRQRGPAR